MAQYYLQAKIFFAQPLHNTNSKSNFCFFKKAENFFKNENLDQLSDAEKKTTLLNNFTLKITSSLNLDLPKSSQFASKVYHITR